MTDEQARDLVRTYVAGDETNVDPDAEVSHAEDGAWVQVWTWVSNDWAEE